MVKSVSGMFDICQCDYDRICLQDSLLSGLVRYRSLRRELPSFWNLRDTVVSCNKCKNWKGICQCGAAEWGSTKELPTQWYKTSELVLSGAFFIIFLIQLESCCFVDLISPSLLLVFVPSRLLLISTRASLHLSGLVLIQRQPQPCSYYKTKQAIYYRKVGHFFVSITSL